MITSTFGESQKMHDSSEMCHFVEAESTVEILYIFKETF